ncbi:MAG: HK97 family phage prohead protease [Candidatus Thiodiazotropha sp.]
MRLLRREYPIQDLKLDAGDTSEMLFSGYGAVFGNIDAIGDVIEPGAFQESLSEAKKSGIWPSMLLQHGGFFGSAEDQMPVGIWTEMGEDGHGLKLTGKLADIERGRDAYTLMKMEPRPAITGLSIGYIPIEWENRSKPEDPRRKLKKVKLMEVSLVTFPANDQARVSHVKTLEETNSMSDVERYMRDVYGMPRSEAKTVIAMIKRYLPRDAGDDSQEALIKAALNRNLQILGGENA